MKELFWVGFGQGISMLASILTIKFLTNVISLDTYGYYNLLLVAMILPSWILFAPLNQPLQRYYAGYKEDNRLSELAWTTTTSYFWVSLFSLIAFNGAVFIGFISYAGVDAISLHIASLIFVVEAWISLGNSLSSAARDRFRVSMTMTSVAVIRPLSILISAHYLGYTLSSIMLGYLASSVALLLYATRPLVETLKRPISSRFNVNLLKTMLRYGLPFGAWSLFAWMQQYLDRYVVESIVGAEALGSYVASMQTASLPFSIAGGLLAQLVTPVIYQMVGNGDDPVRLSEATSFIKKLSLVMAGLGVLVVTAYALFGNWFMNVLTSKAFAAPSSLIAILALSTLLTTIAQLMTLVLLANNSSGKLLIVKVLPGLASIPIMWILVSKFKLHGAAIGALLVSVVFLLLIIIVIKKLDLYKLVEDV
jgi:O-antigen/teichoic acid export membrane protein